MKIPVMEVFGPTVQGEGMVIGQKTMFVRTAGCDYACSWCDSKFTWDGSEKESIRLLEPEEIWAELKAAGGDRFSHVTISGGNPALLKALDGFVGLLHQKGMKVALETQGSRWQPWFLEIDELTISPKPPSSGMKTDFEILDEIVQQLKEAKKGTFSLKVVIFNQDDFDYAIHVHQRYPGVDMYLQVGNEDLVTTDQPQLVSMLLDKYEQLIDKVMDCPALNDVRVLPQLHTYIWGNARGV